MLVKRVKRIPVISLAIDHRVAIASNGETKRLAVVRYHQLISRERPIRSLLGSPRLAITLLLGPAAFDLGRKQDSRQQYSKKPGI
jgi:hypothetical protein